MKVISSKLSSVSVGAEVVTSGGPSGIRVGLATAVRLLCGVSGGATSVIEFVVDEVTAGVVVTAAR